MTAVHCFLWLLKCTYYWKTVNINCITIKTVKINCITIKTVNINCITIKTVNINCITIKTVNINFITRDTITIQSFSTFNTLSTAMTPGWRESEADSEIF
jgi:hypothetical protein